MIVIKTLQQDLDIKEVIEPLAALFVRIMELGQLLAEYEASDVAVRTAVTERL